MGRRVARMSWCKRVSDYLHHSRSIPSRYHMFKLPRLHSVLRHDKLTFHIKHTKTQLQAEKAVSTYVA